jgi:nitrite reductase/ring-hydroxylating ferredoxin subunit
MDGAGRQPPPSAADAADTSSGAPGPSRELLAAAARFAAELHGGRPLGPDGRSRDGWATNVVLSAVDRIDDLENGPVRWHVVCAIGGDGPDAALLGPDDPLPEPRLQVIAPARALLGLCEGSLGYDGFLLSGRARLARVPHSFDSVLHDLLRFGRDPEQAAALAEWWATQRDTGKDGAVEVVRKRDGDRIVTLPRHCPHDGEPFDLAEVCDGRITCPRHRWVYDVRTGACLRGDRSVNLFGRPS